MRLSVSTKRISRIFHIGDLRSGHFCDLPLVNGKKIKSVIFTLAQAYLSGIISYRTVVDNSSKNMHCLPPKGHLRSPEVTNRHLPITFDQKEIETWDWCQYVRLGQANRMICNMTHFGHHLTLAWLDLRSSFDLELSKSFYIWFDAPS